jgi:hypothetical protein
VRLAGPREVLALKIERYKLYTPLFFYEVPHAQHPDCFKIAGQDFAQSPKSIAKIVCCKKSGSCQGKTHQSACGQKSQRSG